MPSLSPKKPRPMPLLLYTLLTILTILLTFRAHLQDFRIPRACGRVVLVSAARHGSTWFVDCAEGCTAKNGTYGRLNRETELWVSSNRGMLRYLSAREAAEYVKRNRSVKLFPTSLEGRESRMREFLELVKEEGVPVFMLRRDLKDTFRSLSTAKETGMWNTVKVDRKIRTGVEERVIERVVTAESEDRYFRRYEERIESFFEEITRIMRDTGVVWDALSYDDIVERRMIFGQRNKCYIRNCNNVKKQMISWESPLLWRYNS